jgi:hypothetical protein
VFQPGEASSYPEEYWHSQQSSIEQTAVTLLREATGEENSIPDMVDIVFGALPTLTFLIHS